jgi:hypothetical protein
MSNKKDKERWIKIQENNKKTCENCSELFWNKDGNPCCSYGDESGGYVIHNPIYIKQVHAICFDKYNKNKI